jgi:phosphate-selective porin OprO/OprP
MRSLATCFLVLVLTLLMPGQLARAQDQGAAGKTAQSATAAAASDEVEQLRAEVAAQRQMIEALRTTVQQLVEAKDTGSASPTQVATETSKNEGTLVNTALVTTEQASKQPAEKKTEAPVIAGFNGEHWFIKSADGNFQIQPYGYLQTDYRAYRGDGAPADTFVIRRARFGFQGNWGTHYEFALLADAAATSGSIIRDVYVNIKALPEFQVQVGQFKEPFAQELLTAVTNIDFVERSLASLLYPSAATAFRSPGITAHGDIAKGTVQYWAGAFNGKGIGAVNTTNQPEIIGRLRFYPWHNKKDSSLQGLAFGGAIGWGRSRALSNEQSFSGALPDVAFTFFPQFRINGPIERYNGEFAWTHGPWGLKGEYVQLNQFRHGAGSDQVLALNFTDLPGIIGKSWYGSLTYLLTGEKRPENGTPKVKHPLFGPKTPGTEGGRGWGAWEVGFRYSALKAKETGINQLTAFTPGATPTFNDRTDQFTIGLNWYPNYWVRYMLNFNIDRAKDPTVGGVVPQNFYVLLQRMQFRF